MAEATENWRDVVGYEGLYEVSDLGRVRKMSLVAQLPEYLNHKFYPTVNLYRCGKNRNIVVHRIVAQTWLPNPDNKPCVDHINGDKSDNRVLNLRWATYGENCQNTRVRRDNSSGYKGVSFHKATGKYSAQIQCVKKLHIGLFTTAEEAHSAYCAKATELFGEFARFD